MKDWLATAVPMKQVFEGMAAQKKKQTALFLSAELCCFGLLLVQ